MRILISALILSLFVYIFFQIPEGFLIASHSSEETIQARKERGKAEIEKARAEIEKARAQQAHAKIDVEKANLEILITRLEANKARIAHQQEIELKALKFQQDLEFQKFIAPINYTVGATWRIAIIALIVTAMIGVVEIGLQRHRTNQIRNELARLVYPDERGSYPVSMDQIVSGGPRGLQLPELKVGGEARTKMVEAERSKVQSHASHFRN